MMPRTILTLRVAAIAILVLLGACASAPATRYYVLSPTAALPIAGAAAPVSVLVRDVALPQYLDRAQIVVRGSGHRLEMIENELWAGNLSQDMTGVLVENLGRLLASERIAASAAFLHGKPEYRVEVEVLRFERGADGRVALEARWSLRRMADGSLLASPIERLSGAPLAADAGFDAVVASMSSLWGELAAVVARRIQAADAAPARGKAGA